MVETYVAAARTWWFEALGLLVALALGVAAALGGDLASGLLAVVAAVAFVDRIRLRMDNRTLAAQVRRGRQSSGSREASGGRETSGSRRSAPGEE